jgi:DNA polymerase III subunit epsilon
MREIVFDTETTGTDPERGDRIVEIGMIELIDLIPTGKSFHAYINPERDVPAEVVRVHGLTGAFLSDKPVFGDPSVIDGLLEFIADDPLVAHNAEFDRRFLNAELKLLGLAEIPKSRCVDTLAIARKKFPGAPASLDALCRRFNVDLTRRDKHGALLDSQLLAAVYLELKGGRERRLSFLDEADTQTQGSGVLETGAVDRTSKEPLSLQRPTPLPPLSTPAEREAHAAFVATLGKASVWHTLLQRAHVS